ncbi:hypothetical protein C4565_05075 [Candidatus Parcubacteria bacterium]|nr:MAG: hypothetical protein C4565_05075 [Candidatus Parcubacteria bacterium]
MKASIAPQELDWLKLFFSGENYLKWHEIETTQAPAQYLNQVMPWIKSLSNELANHPIVLPIFGNGGPICWYGMAITDRQFFQLIDEILSFIGPSFSDFNGEWTELTSKDDNEIALKERFGNHVISFKAQRVQDREEIEKALMLYNSLLSRRPELQNRTQRPFGKIRADFDRALLAAHEVRAKDFFNELCLSGRINAEQRKCLEIRLLAGLHRTEELAKNQVLIASVAELSLPPQTLIDIVEALYQTYILPIDESTSIEEILLVFKQSISRLFGPLFKERKGIRNPIVLRSFLLFEMVSDIPNIARCDGIINAYATTANKYDLAKLWYKWLLNKVNKSQTIVDSKTNIEKARQAIADEEYGIALNLCFELVPAHWAYSALLRCAVELNSSEATKKVLELLEDASRDAKANFSEKDNARVEALLRIAKPDDKNKEISGWISWAEGVELERDRKHSLEILQNSVAKWSVDEYANDAECCKSLAQLIGNASGDTESIYRDAFPSLVDFFVEKFDQPCRAFIPIYGTLIKVMGWSGTLSADELDIVFSLTEVLLATGPSKHDYEECLKDLREIVIANISPINFDWALNLSEILVSYPCQDDGELRLGIFMEVISKMEAISHRISKVQSVLLNILCQDYRCHDYIKSLSTSVQSGISTREASSFSGLIGIYSLVESAGQRAKAVISEFFPEARIEINHDEVSTDRLFSLARNADYFIFAWKSSKHQAYYCVKDARKGREVILPSGKGSASIINSLLEKLSLFPDLD